MIEKLLLIEVKDVNRPWLFSRYQKNNIIWRKKYYLI
jgi:hypothetical protein